MAFALAIRESQNKGVENQTIFSTTLVIVITTVILCGGLTTPMLQWLKIRVGVEEERELQSFESLRTSPSEPRVLHSELNPGRSADKAFLVQLWHNFDANYVKPLLTHARPPLTDNLPQCCLPLARLLTTEQQQSPPTLVGTEQPDDSDADLVADDQELNYGEPSERNRVLRGTNSVVNDNHVMVGGPEPGQEFVIAETHSAPAGTALLPTEDPSLLDVEDDEHHLPTLTSLHLVVDENDDDDDDGDDDDVKLLQA